MAKSKRKRPKIGDVIEIATPKGLAYFQYTHRLPKYGALIRVLPGIYNKQPNNFADLVQQPEEFFVFFPLGAAVSRNIVIIVSNEQIPDWAKHFPLMRVPGAIDKSGQVLDWWLWDGEKAWKIDELSKEHCGLSIREIWNDTMLVERIVEGWAPSDDV